MAKCPHMNFRADVRVNRISDTGRFSADVTIKCVECGVPMRFIGLPVGSDPEGACVNIDGTEARMAIAPRGEVASALEGGTDVGFTVRRIDVEGKDDNE